jgi:homoserine dehydrogenase
VLLVMVTHEGPERSVIAALDKLEGSSSLIDKPMLMHILGN